MDMYFLAVNNDGYVLKYVPKKFKTKEIQFSAVRQDGNALRFMDIKKLTKEEYTEICRISFERNILEAS